MGSRPLTTRQKHWLDHLTAAADSKGTLVDYARGHQLKPKHLYQWKKRLIALGYLDREGAVKHTASVRVAPTPSPTLAKANLVMPNGFRLELQGTLDRYLIRELIAAASEAP
jgi:hypothetical protein